MGRLFIYRIFVFMDDIRLVTYSSSNTIPADLPGKSLFHSVELFEVFEETDGYKPFYMVAWNGDKAVARLLAVVRNGRRMFSSRYTKRCEIYEPGEFLVEDINKEELFESMINHLSMIVRPYCFIIELRNLPSPLFCYKGLRESGFFPITRIKVYNKLDDELEDSISQSRRKQINKGLSLGAKVKASDNPEEIKSFAKLLKYVYSPKIFRHFPDLDFFLKLVAVGSEDDNFAKVFLVKYQDKIIGGSVCVYSGDTAYLLFSGGMRKSFARVYPGVLAVWEAMNHARKCGYKRFQFMHAGNPFRRYGFRDFILRFGGNQRSTRRWFKFKWKWLNVLLTKLYV